MPETATVSHELPTDDAPHVPDDATPATTAAETTPTDETSVDLGRAAWLLTSIACLIAGLIVLLRGDYGYAGVTFAVALAAAINLF